MLAIYNVAGQRVRTLVDDSIRASTATHEAVWDGLDNRGASVASGIYLYRLTAPGFSQSRKLVLLK
jgi:flagellar hook assembly protein FlgD